MQDTQTIQIFLFVAPQINKLYRNPIFCVTFLDINVCTNNLHDCRENTICVNNNGSFTCSCKAGYSGNGTFCQGECRRILAVAVAGQHNVINTMVNF